MKISERIMSQLEEPAAGDDSWVDGSVSATESAAEIATEADVLMDDLAESLQKLMILTDGGGTWTLEDQDRAQAALKHYQEYVK